MIPESPSAPTTWSFTLQTSTMALAPLLPLKTPMGLDQLMIQAQVEEGQGGMEMGRSWLYLLSFLFCSSFLRLELDFCFMIGEGKGNIIILNLSAFK